MYEQPRLFCMTCYGSGWSTVCAYHHPDYPKHRRLSYTAQPRGTDCICVLCEECNRLNAEGVDTRWLPS